MPPNDYNVPGADDRQTIVCLHCQKAQDVSRKAISVTCRFCYKPLKLKDEVVKAYEARRLIETVGIVTIEKKGNLIADRVNCGGLIVRGRLKGAIHSRGPVLVGPEAEIKGDVVAPTIAVGAGAILEGNYRVGQEGAVVRPSVGKPTPRELDMD